MFTPYQIEQRLLYYIEDSSQKPAIHRLINEAISYVCQGTEPGKDWSFLVTEGTFDVTASGTDIAIVTLPPEVRSVIHVENGTGYTCELHGRNIIVKASSAEAMPSTVTARYYKAQRPVYKLVEDGQGNIVTPWAYDPQGADAPWTTSNPPSDLILLPDEALDAIVYRAMWLYTLQEIEVAANTQFYQSMTEAAMQFLRTNYQLQIDYRTPTGTDASGNQTEELTVGWLVSYAKTLLGGERSELQLISLVNRVASDMADHLKLRGSQRPAIKNSLSDELPTFGDVGTQNMTVSTGSARKIPAEYWKAGMKYHCLRLLKQLDEVAMNEYNTAMNNLSDLFYSLGTGGTFGYTTYGDMMDYLRSIWKNQRSDFILWATLNQTIAAVMRAINTGETLKSQVYTATTTGIKEFDLPADFKVATKLTAGENTTKPEIICRSFNARGIPFAEQTVWQFPFEPHGFVPFQAFCIRGKKLVLANAMPVNAKITLWYYPKHVWPYNYDEQGRRTTFKLDEAIPIDTDLLAKALEAKVALENGDVNKHTILKKEFDEDVLAYNESQNRSLSEDSCVIAATPPVDHLLNCNTWGFY